MASSNTSNYHQTKHQNKFVLAMRKIYNPLGFEKGYNFPLFIIFAGAMLGFSLARISYLNIGGKAPSSYRNGSSPGEWYQNGKGYRRVGITLHLAGVIPMGLLMIWQFVPIIRYKALLFHRINGYLIIILSLVGNAGALMIARTTFGGHIETQAAVGLLVISTTIALAMAYYNIKRLQIDQHRAWMLRAMFYFGTIITLRIIMIISALIITQIGSYSQIQTCGEIAFKLPDELVAKLYPVCGLAASTGDTEVIVKADFNAGYPQNIGAALGLSFGMAMWLAFFIHLVGVEIYLNLTPAEGQRLRKVSYERQLEAGHSHPGSSGLTSDRWGDAEEWKPTIDGLEGQSNTKETERTN